MELDIVAIIAAAAAMISAIAAPVITELIRTRSEERIRKIEIAEEPKQRLADEFIESYFEFLRSPALRESRLNLAKASYSLASKISDSALRDKLLALFFDCRQYDTLENTPEEKNYFIETTCDSLSKDLLTYLSGEEVSK